MSLLAGWDLCRLLNRVYREVIAPDGDNLYEISFDRYRISADKTTLFVSLNYDLILERALTHANKPWHYAHVPTTVERDPESIRIIKPHGSFNWCFLGNEPYVTISTHYRLNPVTLRSDEKNRFNANRFFSAENFHPHDQGLEDFVKAPGGSGMV